MGLKRSTILRSILAAIVLALGAVILGFVPINLSFVKDTIEQHVRDILTMTKFVSIASGKLHSDSAPIPQLLGK